MVHASALAGACAGLVSSIVTCPLDVVKTRLQAQGAASRATISTASHAEMVKLGSLGGTNGIGRATLGDRQAYNGLLGTLTHIYRSDGLRGFYRGLGPTIFGYLPTWAIYFTVYDNCKGFLAREVNQEGEEDFLNHILSAMTAGAASTICTSPLWVVKTRFMLQSPKDTSQKPYKHTGDAFYQIFRTEGVKGFYKGLLPSLLGVSHVAVQFPLYEAFKGWARDKKKSDLLIKGEDDGDFELEASTILGCSSSAKMIASVMTYPHEVLRTKMQMQPRTSGGGSNGSGNGNGNGNGNESRSFSTSTIGNQRQDFSNKGFQNQISTTTQNRISNSHWLPFRRRFSASIQNHNSTQSSSTTPTTVRNGNPYSGVLKICKSIATEEGIRGFYRGMGVNLIRTVPSSALTILTYEVMMSHLTANDHDSDNQDDTD